MSGKPADSVVLHSSLRGRAADRSQDMAWYNRMQLRADTKRGVEMCVCAIENRTVFRDIYWKVSRGGGKRKKRGVLGLRGSDVPALCYCKGNADDIDRLIMRVAIQASREHVFQLQKSLRKRKGPLMSDFVSLSADYITTSMPAVK
jgi:hypothetical protein